MISYEIIDIELEEISVGVEEEEYDGIDCVFVKRIGRYRSVSDVVVFFWYCWCGKYSR